MEHDPMEHDPMERKKDKKDKKDKKEEEEKVKEIEFPKPPKPFEPTGKTFKLDPKSPFKPTMKQIKEVFQNRIDEEQAIDDNMFTGFLGMNSQAYIIYYIMEQQKQIDALMDHVGALTKQVNLLTQNKRL